MKQIMILTVLIVLTLSILVFGAENNHEPFTVVTSEEVKAMIERKEPGLVLIDTRTPGLFDEAHIEGAVNLFWPVLRKNPYALKVSKDSKLVFYCIGCDKSPMAARLAASLGYSNLYVLIEGLPAWEEKGFAIYAGPKHEKMLKTTRIPPKELQVMLASTPTSIMLVDVRDPSEYDEGHIPGAVNIPVSQFAARSNSIEKDKKIIVYCNSGGRSYNAYRKLKKMAYGNISQANYVDWQGAGLPVSKGTVR